MASGHTTPYPETVCCEASTQCPRPTSACHLSGFSTPMHPNTCGMMQPAKHTPSLKPKAGNKATRSCQPCSRWVKDQPCKLYKSNSDLGNIFLLSWTASTHLSNQPVSAQSTTFWSSTSVPRPISSSIVARPESGMLRAAAKFSQPRGRSVGRGPGFASRRARPDHFGGALGIRRF